MALTRSFENIIAGFYTSVEQHGDLYALHVDGKKYTYKELALEADRIAQTIQDIAYDSQFIAILADRSLTTYASIIAILKLGKAYMPLNINLSEERNIKILEQSGASALILDERTVEFGAKMANKANCSAIFPKEELRKSHPLTTNQSIAWGDKPQSEDCFQYQKVEEESLCYLIFTSGSTGVPKGVMVRHRNVNAYIELVREIFPTSKNDRFSQVADISFDQSVNDIFCAWKASACLYCVPKYQIMTVSEYIQEHQLTVWHSVPSLTSFMIESNTIKEGAFPSLRWATFGGEAVSFRYATLWQKAASNAKIGVFYGPTEATVYCTYYPMTTNAGTETPTNGIMPIGWPLGETKVKVINANAEDVAEGEMGELCIGGPLVTKGYIQDAKKTAEKYISLEMNNPEVWYRTGDLVRLNSTNACINYFGRNDEQVKIHGFRVELGEIENILRQASGTEESAVIPLPKQDGIVTGVVGFIVGPEDKRKLKQIIAECRSKLSTYMVPRQIIFIDKMPLTINGKIDRASLAARLEQKQPHGGLLSP